MKVTVRFYIGREVKVEIDDKYKKLINEDDFDMYEELVNHINTNIINPQLQEDDDSDIGYVVAEGVTDKWGNIPYLVG